MVKRRKVPKKDKNNLFNIFIFPPKSEEMGSLPNKTERPFKYRKAKNDNF